MNTDEIKKFLKNNNGYISTSEFLDMNINKPTIKKFVDSGFIRRVGHGLYIDNNLMEDEYYIIQKNYPLAVFSYDTALYILNLTNRAPYNIDITVPRDKKVRGNYNVHRVSLNYYNIGIIEVLSPFGNPIKIYNAERCICDIIRCEDGMDLELQNRILDYYFKSKDKDIDKLLEYAKLFGIYEKVNTIVEVMIKW